MLTEGVLGTYLARVTRALSFEQRGIERGQRALVLHTRGGTLAEQSTRVIFSCCWRVSDAVQC